MPISEMFAVVAAFASGLSAPAHEPNPVPIESTISAQAVAMESVTLDKVAAAIAEQLRALEVRRNEFERVKLEQTAVAGSEVTHVDAPADPLAVLVVATPDLSFGIALKGQPTRRQ